MISEKQYLNSFNLNKPPLSGGFFNAWAKCQVAGDLDDRRYDESRARSAEYHSGHEARGEIVLPDTKNSQRPVNADRHQRKKQPDPRYWLRFVYSPP